MIKYPIYEVDDFYQLNENKNMNSSFFELRVRDWAGAVTSSVLVAVIGYVLMVGDVFLLDYKLLINTAVMAGLGSLLKALLTTEEGKFVGMYSVK